MTRRVSRQITVGGTAVGGGADITVQSMTTAPTDDVGAVSAQILALERAGCDIVRAAIPDEASALALAEIKRRIRIPLVADIHFDYKLALAAIGSGADKIRINPGNIGSRERVREVAAAARDAGIPIRVGVNGGSLERGLRGGLGTEAEALAASALRSCELLESFGFADICVSAKSSDVVATIEAYRLLAARCDYPLHLGVTEAGTEFSGLIRGSAGIGALLADGIGDTLRVSLTADPAREVAAGIELLASLGLRRGGARMISCPTCARCRYDMMKIAREVEERLADYRERDVTVAVMGCAVNGPGEARAADFGIAGGDGMGVLFRHGEIVGSAPEPELVARLFELVDAG
ncbi:MAG: flavodoxin-dependent (E)-4-hydroxy-3-methylbut-2-enyl-diphosphate synthase [Oscillospiraceae bacterium]|jgi:(E)-4-hydroxy-3-methylbut-2-enyl-diphosphate synthase|nr:flavodoxin-dependent (E)-4-hydroxy-3-methylbut-2-enyl-diphosphate synthase [Oscillospiraceae bacterium]